MLPSINVETKFATEFCPRQNKTVNIDNLKYDHFQIFVMLWVLSESYRVLESERTVRPIMDYLATLTMFGACP